MSVPERSEIVIVGGGVVGVSIAYHLARRGKADVTLVERTSLTNGSTWHAAGLVGQLRSSSSLTRLMRRSVEIYRDFEAGTGHVTGWRGVGRAAGRVEPGPVGGAAAGLHAGQELRLRHPPRVTG